jgi:mevalonate kinase
MTYTHNKITVLKILQRKNCRIKNIFLNGGHGKAPGLDLLNSYLSIPILINSKDNIEATHTYSKL